MYFKQTFGLPSLRHLSFSSGKDSTWITLHNSHCPLHTRCIQNTGNTRVPVLIPFDWGPRLLCFISTYLNDHNKQACFLSLPGWTGAASEHPEQKQRHPWPDVHSRLLWCHFPGNSRMHGSCHNVVVGSVHAAHSSPFSLANRICYGELKCRLLPLPVLGETGVASY